MKCFLRSGDETLTYARFTLRSPPDQIVLEAYSSVVILRIICLDIKEL
jgi:hypothetical protein